MPFILIDEEKKKARDGNDFDELPPGVTPDDVVKLIVAATLEGIPAAVQKALQETLEGKYCIKQKSGLLVWGHTGKIVDP